MDHEIVKPQWKSSYSVEVFDDAVLLLDENDCTLLSGAPYAMLAPLLDGRHTLDDLHERLGGRMFYPQIAYMVRAAARGGYVIEGSDAPPEVEAFWHAQGVDMHRVAHALETRSIAILDQCGEGERLRNALDLLGVRTSGEAGLRVVLTDDYLRDDLAALNDEALRSGRPWMLVRPHGSTVWIGPIFRPGVTGCYECLAQRLRGNRQVENYLARDGQPRRVPLAVLPTLAGFATQLAATAATAALVVERHCLDGRIVTFDATAFESRTHELTRRPQCPACGTARHRDDAPQPVRLQTTPVRHAGDGGIRARAPEVTWEALKRHVSPISGAVRNVEPTGSGARDGLTFSYAAGHNFALMSTELRFALQNLRGRSGGKGTTAVQAKVSAMCEAIERYSGVYRGDEPAVSATFDELGDRALQPNDLMRFSEHQFANRESWNAVHPSGFHKVPMEFDPSRRIDWSPAWSLTHERFVHVPSAYVYFGHPQLREWFFCTSDSNGNAAGVTIEEAILQGFLELAERDAVALWWYNRVQRPAVDLDAFSEPYLDALREHYRGLSRDLWAIDLTSDLGIPVIAAISRRIDHEVEDIVLGFGAHLDPRIALLRAVTEINQFMPAVEKRDADNNTIYWYPEREAIDWFQTAKLNAHRHLLPTHSSPHTPRSFASRAPDDLCSAVEVCLDRARRANLEVLVVDQTQPDIGLAVVKVMVPGLRHFWKRFGPGRLYDVPVALGWRDTPLAEEQLNPIGIFF
jgi:ribosomal protein S12 methylthiotransferase accessory factor